MRELCRTGDHVTLSYVRALLTDEGIAHVVLDETTSSLFAGAIVPRVVVADQDWFMASRLLMNTDFAALEPNVALAETSNGEE